MKPSKLIVILIEFMFLACISYTFASDKKFVVTNQQYRVEIVRIGRIYVFNDIEFYTNRERNNIRYANNKLNKTNERLHVLFHVTTTDDTNIPINMGMIAPILSSKEQAYKVEEFHPYGVVDSATHLTKINANHYYIESLFSVPSRWIGKVSLSIGLQLDSKTWNFDFKDIPVPR